VNKGLVTRNPHYLGGDVESIGFTVREKPEGSRIQELFVVISGKPGCDRIKGMVTVASGQDNCDADSIGWTIP
jgi:hypothetical protein